MNTSTYILALLLTEVTTPKGGTRMKTETGIKRIQQKGKNQHRQVSSMFA